MICDTDLHVVLVLIALRELPGKNVVHTQDSALKKSIPAFSTDTVKIDIKVDIGLIRSSSHFPHETITMGP